MTPVRWGFLGAGFVASRALAPAVASAPTAELVAVASRDPGRAAAIAPDATIRTDYADVLADDDVDAVYVSLTNEAHLPWVVRAVAAGKHVLCEKPLGLTADEVATMVQAAQAADRLLVEATWTRWHPRTLRAIELLRSGELGTPTAVDATFTFSGVPRDNYRWDPTRGGGALYDVGPYAVGAAMWAMAGPLGAVAATARESTPGVDAATTARLEIGTGLADIRVSIDDAESQQLVVTTDRGRLALSEPAFTSWHEPSALHVETDGIASVESFAACDPYALMVDAVSRRVAGDADAWVLPHDDSLRVAAALDAVRAASRG